MGLEWHNRKRSTNGRFARRNEGMMKAGEPPMTQIHIRVTKNLAIRLRNMAIAEHEEITQICAIAIEGLVEDWEIERENEDQRRTIGQKNDGPAEDHRTDQQ